MTDAGEIFKQVDHKELEMDEVAFKEVAFKYGVTKTTIRRQAGDGIFSVDWQFWLKRTEWTPEQAVCLLYGVNPLDYDKIKSEQQIEMLRLTAEDKKNMSPYLWKQFGVDNYLPLPKQLRDIQKSITSKVNDDIGSKGIVEQALTVIHANSNDIEFSGLLNIPKRKDDWFQVIDDMTRAYHTLHKTMPNETKAWMTLWISPPDGYGISTGKDRGENCLIMAGQILSRSAFTKRWTNYTAITPNNTQ